MVAPTDSQHVINIGSLAGREAYVGGSIYCAVKQWVMTDTANKSAVKAFTTSLMKEVVATGIRVSEVAPGFVETNFSVVRFRGDEEKAKAVYKGFEPREYGISGADCSCCGGYRRGDRLGCYASPPCADC